MKDLVRTAGFKLGAGVAVWLALITTLRFKPWEGGSRAEAGPRSELGVGFLPVT